jgi:hypothetical protein
VTAKRDVDANWFKMQANAYFISSAACASPLFIVSGEGLDLVQ